MGQHLFLSQLSFSTSASGVSFGANNNSLVGEVANITVHPAEPNTLGLQLVSAMGTSTSNCNPLTAILTVQDAFTNTVTSVANGNATLRIAKANTNSPAPIVSSSFVAPGALSAPVVSGAATLPAFQISQPGQYTVSGNYNNLSLNSQSFNISRSTPTISSIIGAATSRSQPVSYNARGVCGATAAMVYTSGAASSGNTLMTQPTQTLLQSASFQHRADKHDAKCLVSMRQRQRFGFGAVGRQHHRHTHKTQNRARSSPKLHRSLYW